ncbi:hypothetical protein K3V85_14715, partial [Listeria monocytogenes]|nr:hypothetical protein [Listeria monocytogenes]
MGEEESERRVVDRAGPQLHAQIRLGERELTLVCRDRLPFGMRDVVEPGGELSRFPGRQAWVAETPRDPPTDLSR